MVPEISSPVSEQNPVHFVVDLDGTLIRSDLLVESAFAYLGANPLRIVALITLLLKKGKAALKSKVASEVPIDVTNLPYDQAVLDLIEQARGAGQRVYVASASNERYVAAVSKHIGADGWFASSDDTNLSAEAKAQRLVEVFGHQGFDYVGNDRADIPVWAVARRCIAVHPSGSVERSLKENHPSVEIIQPSGFEIRSWAKLIRIHQWAKNGLVFVAPLAAHRVDLLSIIQSMAAFLSFSFAASAVYILNDLVDIEADRKHPTKKRRPLAAGTLPILAALPVGLGLALAAFALALPIGPWFALVLFGYLFLTTAYTFFLKRKMLVDIVVLATLYTIRVIGGAQAIEVPVSEWLLGFSMFIFTALALIKRYVELATRVDAGLPDPSNRNYLKSDLDIIAALAAAASFNAVTVFALYISSETVQQLYRHPKMLWLACPILMYWLARALLLAHRRLMDDDPILFALKDWNSLVAFGLMAATLVFAS